MIEVKGKYCKDAKIFTDNIEEEALKQVYENCDCPAFKDAKIRLMPDCHAGANCNVGFSVPIGEFVNPNHIGVDIGCRMTTIELSKPLDSKDYKEFEHKVQVQVPTGFNVNSKKVFDDKTFYKFLNKEYAKARSTWPEMIENIGTIDEKYITSLCKRVGMDLGLLFKSVGSVGGGNHFMEYGETDDGRAFFTVHCGSRNFGLKVCKYWVKIATNPDKSLKKEAVERIKASEPDKSKWQELIKNTTEELKTRNPNGFLSGENLKGYLSDMVIATAYASFNHEMIVEKVKEILQKMCRIKEIDRIVSVHNYIDFSDHILRKGAIRSYKGERMIIPFNMRDGIAICEGKSNDDWNCTAPHGAGRIMSRSDAKNRISMEEFKASMEGIYSTTVCEATIDESPMAYKPMEEILQNIEPTAEVLFFIKPKINIKAAEVSMND